MARLGTTLQLLTRLRSISGNTHLDAASGLVQILDQRVCSAALASTSAPSLGCSFASTIRQLGSKPDYSVSLGNLRDNEGATKQRIRVGRGDGGPRGNYSGRGMKGQNARGRGPHLLYDGGQLGLLKFPVTRQRTPYEVLYKQLSLWRLMEYIQLGLLDHTKVITMKDLVEVGCVTGSVKYGVMLYGSGDQNLGFPINIQVTACDEEARAAIEGAGGSVTRVYYEKEGLQGLMKPEKYTSKNLPLPLPAHSWHPRYNSKFDAIGQIPPDTRPALASS